MRSSNYDQIVGQQFTLGFDASTIELVEIRGGALSMDASHINYDQVSEGLVSALYAESGALSFDKEEVLFTLVLRGKQSGKLSELMRLNDAITETKAYIKEGTSSLATDVRLNFTKATPTSFELYQNRPNPFNGQTVIGFELPEQGQASLRVFDINGKVIYSEKGSFEVGYNEYRLHSGQLPAVGVLYYELSTANHRAVKRMVVVK